MESSSIELKVLFGKDLKAFNFFQKLPVYALVSLVNDDPERKVEKPQPQRTPTDKENDGNPEWNHEMRFDLGEISFQDTDHLFLQFELYAEAVFGEKLIGEVRVPLKDMIDDSHNGIVRFVHYEVRTTDAKSNGVLSFSYKVNNAKGYQFGGKNSIDHKIDGFSIVHRQDPSPELELQSFNPGFDSLASSKVEYPSLDWQAPCEIDYHTPAGVIHPSQEVCYQPPQDLYLPPPPHLLPPPPPPPPFLHHLPPPPMWGGARYRPYPPQVHPWVNAGGYDSSAQRTESPKGGRSQIPGIWRP